MLVILRKPYAFFIKYFKLMHLIMAFFMVLLLLQTNSFLSFFNEYLNSNMIVIGKGFQTQVFNPISYFYVSLVLVLDVIVWVVLAVKEKKSLFYILNFAGYVLVLALYIYFNSILVTMDKQIVDARLLMTIRDLVIIIFVFQSLFTFITFTRFLGFDIKKFDFQKDLKDLNIEDTDNEEFEINVEVDKDKVKRTLKYHYRNFKYYVKENIRLIIPVLSILIIAVGYVIYQSINGGVTKYSENVYFKVPNYSLKVVDTYVTNKDYKANDISDDKSLVLLKISVKTTNRTESFVFGKFVLTIGKDNYYHDIKYTDAVKDIGETYIKQKLDSEYDEYLLVYEVPKADVNKKMSLTYVKEISSGIFSKDTVVKVNLKPENIDKNSDELDIVLNQNIEITSELINGNMINFKAIEIAEIFNINYKTTIFGQVYNFYEPLQAEFYGSYDKALLSVNVQSDTETKELNIFKFVTTYGKLNYTINGVSKSINISKQVVPKKVNTKTCYFEIPLEVLGAQNVNLVFNTRGQTLRYKIK